MAELFLLLGLLIPFVAMSGGSSGGDDDPGEDADENDVTQDEFEQMLDDEDAEALTHYRSGDAGGFNLDIEFIGDWTLEQQEAVVNAAEYLSDVILEDVADVGGRHDVDDLKVEARLEKIDGTGGVLGSGSPTLVRSDSQLPLTGTMKFDAEDAAEAENDGLWESLVLHEMLHVLGVGTIWDNLGLTQKTAGSNNTAFIGRNANEAFGNEYPELAATRGQIQVESDGGDKAAGHHWDEVDFKEEIATTYLNANNRISLMTIASLEDLGYDTYYDDALSDDRVGPKPQNPFSTIAT